MQLHMRRLPIWMRSSRKCAPTSPLAEWKLSALETHTDNLTDPILGLCALGGAIRVSVTQLPPANTSPAPDMIAAMLTLNRTDLPDQDWRRAKKHCLGASCEAGSKVGHGFVRILAETPKTFVQASYNTSCKTRCVPLFTLLNASARRMDQSPGCNGMRAQRCNIW